MRHVLATTITVAGLALSTAAAFAQAGTAGPSNSPPLATSPGGPGVVVVPPAGMSGEVPGNAGTAGPSNSPPMANPPATGTVTVVPAAPATVVPVAPGGRSGEVPGNAGTAGPSNSPPLQRQP